MIRWKCRVATMGPPSQTDALHHKGCAPSLMPCRHTPATLCGAIILRPQCAANTHYYDGGRSCASLRSKATLPPQSGRPGRARSTLLTMVLQTEWKPPVIYIGQVVRHESHRTLVSPVPTSADRTASPEHTLRLLSQVVQALGSRRHGSHTKDKLARVA